MRILLTGHKGYIGSVAGPVLRAAGHDVVGCDTDLFAGCDFGKPSPEIPQIRKDIRDLTEVDLDGFEAVVHLAALSNDPLGDIDPRKTFEINHVGFGSIGPTGETAGVKPVRVFLVLQHLWSGRRCHS